MVNLLRINTLNYEDILSHYKSVPRTELLSVLKDCFLYAPHKSDLICRMILEICKEDNSLVQEIKEITNTPCPSIESNISLLLYCKCLNFKVPQLKTKVIENYLFNEEEVSIKNELEGSINIELQINEYLNNLEIFLEIFSIPNFDEIYLFKILCIIENYQFDIYECLDELQKECTDYQQYIGTLYLLNNSNIDFFYLINLFLRSLHDKEGVDAFLKILPLINKTSRDRLIPFIYEYFINRRVFKHPQEVRFLFDTPEEIAELKKYIDEDTVKEMKKFMSVQSLESFIPEYKYLFENEVIIPIKREDFKIDQDKKEFFKDFCLLGSPSITHFLSYLEIYKEEMRMNEEEQKEFLKIFDEIFKNRTSFKRIVLDKMIKFKFLQEDFVLK